MLKNNRNKVFFISLVSAILDNGKSTYPSNQENKNSVKTISKGSSVFMKNMKEILADKNNKVDVNMYQTYINDLYSEINAKRDFADLYGYLHRNVGYLGKSIESDENDPSKFILPISWLFSLASKLNINILEAFIKKFPGICPYCLESQCVCYRTNKKPLKPMSAYEIETEIFFKWQEVSKSLVDFNLESAVKFIAKIYPDNFIVWISAGYQTHILKIHQEMTEIHEAYSNFINKKKPINAVMDEIADVFAWILAAWVIKYPKDSIDWVFIDYYVNDCPVCRKAPCKCGLSDSRSATLPDFDKLALVREYLDQLALLFPDHQDVFSNLLKSYSNVLKTQNMPIAWAALTETKAILEKLRKTVTTLDLEGKSASPLYSALNIVNAILKIEGARNHHEKYYDVFLSYSTANKDQVRVIFDFLTSKNINVFMSEKKIQPSSNWEEVIKDALKSSKLLCVVASPESLASEWVKTEADSAWILEIPTLPILYHCDAKDLPDKLRRYQCIDYHEYSKIIDVLKNLP
ncbi:MAG: toll/interleukin-1 receptor domain-containing protein [bacterium]